VWGKLDSASANRNHFISRPLEQLVFPTNALYCN